TIAWTANPPAAPPGAPAPGSLLRQAAPARATTMQVMKTVRLVMRNGERPGLRMPSQHRACLGRKGSTELRAGARDKSGLPRSSRVGTVGRGGSRVKHLMGGFVRLVRLTAPIACPKRPTLTGYVFSARDFRS